MNRFRALWQNVGFILALAFVLGLAVPHGAIYTGRGLMPLLAFIMTLSITGVSLRTFTDTRSVSRHVLVSLLLNYAVLGLSLIGLAFLFVSDPELRAGFVILAAIPPAIAVIPFSYRLGGNVTLSLVGTLAGYLAALGLVPLFSVGFLGAGMAQPERLLINLAEMIAVPIGIAQLLRRAGADGRLERYRGTIINWSFFVVVYSIVGVNQSAFLSEPLVLLPVAGIALFCTFGLAYIIDRAAARLNQDKPSRASYMLLGTMKNNGLAAVIALALYGDRAAVPAAITTAFSIANFIWLTFRVPRQD